MNPDSWDLLAAIGGWTSLEQLRCLFERVQQLPDREVIVEVGVWQGRSALAMGEGCRGTNKKVYAIDPWREYETMKGPLSGRLTEFGVPSIESVYETFLAHRARLQLEAWVEPVRGESLSIASSWSKGPCGMVFIDGDHHYDSVLADLRAWTPLTKRGGLVCGDDWKMESVRRAVTDFVKTSSGLTLEVPRSNTWAFRA